MAEAIPEEFRLIRSSKSNLGFWTWNTANYNIWNYAECRDVECFSDMVGRQNI